jgi:hypothetical protein
MFKYRLHWADGEEAGGAAYAVNINAGDEILTMQKTQAASAAGVRPRAGTALAGVRIGWDQLVKKLERVVAPRPRRRRATESGAAVSYRPARPDGLRARRFLRRCGQTSARNLSTG